jgi:hypothetical protein
MGALSFLKFWQKNDSDGSSARATSSTGGEALMDAVYTRMDERRRSIRIAYPSFGVLGDLPTVELNGVTVIPGNLSLGGFFVKRSLVNMPSEAGQMHKVNLKWPREGVMSFDAKLVSVMTETFHFEFVKKDFRGNLRLQLAFERVFRAGIRGHNLKPLASKEIPRDSGFSEMWMSDLGDFVAFENSQTVICLDGKRIRQNSPSSFEFIDADKEGNWSSKGPLTREFADEVFLFLTNLKRPGPRVSQVLQSLIECFYADRVKS